MLVLVLLLLGYQSFGLLKPGLANADITACSASMHAHAVSPNSQNTFDINVSNDSDTAIQWIKITRPSNNFTVQNSDAPGWTGSNTDEIGYESGSSLAPGDNLDVSITAQSANVQADPANWTVEATDSSTGQNLLVCSGNLDMAITGDVSDITPPVISNVSVDNIAQTDVRISWTTDEASTSQVSYGLDSSYGSSTDLDGTMVTQHTVTLTGLAPGTAYHYRVSSADAAGNPANSADSTFITADKPVVNQNSAINVPITNPGDKTPPTISLSTQLPHVVQSMPNISGAAGDNVAVMRVEYSTDGGTNWLPADKATGLGGKQVTFSFTPSNLDDGNYSIVARAIDGGGNQAVTPAQAVVVDRLPPIVGGSVLSIGPQVLQPLSSGVVSALASVDEKITLSAVGGPTSINLVAAQPGQSAAGSFALTRSPDSGLWSGVISFQKSGTYTLSANSLDGAGNKTSKLIDNIYVAAPARITKLGTSQPLSAKITAYYLEPDSNNWAVWDATAYSQQNPQLTDKTGAFSFLLPAGKYYLKASAKGYHTLNSSIFELKQPTPILDSFGLKPGHDFKLGPIDLSWLNFSSQTAKLGSSTAMPPNDLAKNTLVGQPLPDFNLQSVSGQAVKPIGLLGKPTDLVFLNTWAPAASDQLPTLNQLAGNKAINIEPVALQQNLSQVEAYDGISGYSLNWLADPYSTTSAGFGASNIPTHYFVNRNGVIKKVIAGVLSKQELLNELQAL